MKSAHTAFFWLYEIFGFIKHELNSEYAYTVVGFGMLITTAKPPYSDNLNSIFA